MCRWGRAYSRIPGLKNSELLVHCGVHRKNGFYFGPLWNGFSLRTDLALDAAGGYDDGFDS